MPAPAARGRGRRPSLPTLQTAAARHPLPPGQQPTPEFNVLPVLARPSVCVCAFDQPVLPASIWHPSPPAPPKTHTPWPSRNTPTPTLPQTAIMCVCAARRVSPVCVHELPWKQRVPRAAHTPLGARAMFGHAKQSRWSAHTRLLCARTPISPLPPRARDPTHSSIGAPICPSLCALWRSRLAVTLVF